MELQLRPRLLSTFSFFIILICAATHAQAGLIGSTVNSQYYYRGNTYNALGSPATFVANGTMQNSFGFYYNLTVFNDKIEYDFPGGVSWNASPTSYNFDGLYIASGNLLTFSGAPAFTSVTLDPVSSINSGFNASNVTSNSNQVAVNWQSVSFAPGDKVVIDVISSPIPEPQTYLMMLLGLGIMSFFVKKRQQS